MKNYGFKGFTLAETLIALLVIGIVVALTIPVLNKNINDREYISSYKKAFSDISKAFNAAKDAGEIDPFSGTNNSIGSEANFNAIKAQFRVAKSCSGNLSECWNTNGELWSGESIAENLPAFVDDSGTVWKLGSLDSSGNAPCIVVDVNGMKGPNMYGRDRYPFVFKNENGTWGNCSGMPSVMIPYNVDITTNNEYCPSGSTHPCYYRSWLI